MVDRFCEKFNAVFIEKVFDHARLLFWMEGLTFFWPDFIIHDLINAKGKTFAIARYKKNTYNLNVPTSRLLFKKDIVDQIREEILFHEKPFSAMLPFSYQKIPYKIRYISASLLIKYNKFQKKKENKDFPQWPLDLTSDSLIDVGKYCSAKTNNESKTTNSVLLTHDIDTPESLSNLPYFIEIEESFGFRSTNFIVPKRWKIDHSILQNIMERGHEIGLHGYNHDNRTPFLSKKEIGMRIKKSLDFISRYDVKGYRSPSLLRSKDLLEVLKEYFLYDSSIPNVDGNYFRHNYGCATARCFYYNNLLEIPLTLPTDANLLFQGLKPNNIMNLWIKFTKILISSGGIINLLTHCEKRYSGSKTMLDIYRQYLVFLQDAGISQSKTLSEIACSETM